MKKRICSILAGIFLLGALAACGGGNGNEPGTGGTASGGSSDGPEKVVFWYNNTGDEATVYEQAIAAYNASQDKYVVEGLSVTDAQKVIVAMSSNEAPDVLKISNNEVIQYMLNGLLENLQTYVDAEGFDLGIYSEQSVEANQNADGDVYALPLSAYTIQLFYNKTLLAAAGYDAPPTTMEEMYEMAVKATVLNDDGTFEVVGYPVFPYASARQELIYGFGGHWWDPEDRTTLTPEAAGNLASLEMNVKYREQYGQKAIFEYVADANTGRYTDQDMFFLGKQLFRLDGSWLPSMMANVESDVDWGVTLVPGTEANPELRGTARFETDSVAMPAAAPNKEGAWDFIKWVCGEEGARIIDLGTGNLPALVSLYDDAEVTSSPGFDLFLEALQLGKGIQYPLIADFGEYMNMLNAMLDEVYVGDLTPEEGLADLAKNSTGLS